MVVGKRIGDISRAIYKTVSSRNYDVVREFCGHGVGTAIHEAPEVPNFPVSSPNPRLKAGMVLAIEPMVTMGNCAIDILDDSWTVVTSDNSLSAHFEHTVAIFEDHAEILTDW